MTEITILRESYSATFNQSVTLYQNKCEEEIWYGIQFHGKRITYVRELTLENAIKRYKNVCKRHNINAN